MVFHTKDIEAAIVKGRKYNSNIIVRHILLQNPWVSIPRGSSAFGIIVIQRIDNQALEVSIAKL